MTHRELHFFLEKNYERYNRPDFITLDPVSISHQFSKKQDIEIAGFLAATIAWGQRPTILRNANELIRRMDRAPHDFVHNHAKKDLLQFKNFKHRTFNGVDCAFSIKSLRNIYKNHKSLETTFQRTEAGKAMKDFRDEFFSLSHPHRTEKHVSCPPPAPPRPNGSSGRAAEDIAGRLREFDPKDPVKYDFALLGVGTSEKTWLIISKYKPRRKNPSEILPVLFLELLSCTHFTIFVFADSEVFPARTGRYIRAGETPRFNSPRNVSKTPLP